MHDPRLCFEEGFPTSINGADTSEVFDPHGRVNGKSPLVGWMKTIKGMRVSNKG